MLHFTAVHRLYRHREDIIIYKPIIILFRFKYSKDKPNQLQFPNGKNNKIKSK